MTAMQSVSHSFPKLMRLLVKPGMMCPVWACRVGMEGMAKEADALEVHVSPVAMQMVVGGTAELMCRSGVAVVK